MAIKKLIIGKINSTDNYVFNKQLNFVNDAALSKELGTENIRNEDSQLIIKSLSDIQIADVIQIKINLQEVGTFLVNFDKNSLNEDSRKAIFEQLTGLKDKKEPTISTQTTKTNKILKIINKYNPIYVTFSNKGSLKIDIEKIASTTMWNFPLLVLAIPSKKHLFFSKNDNGKMKTKNSLNSDHIFTLIFSLLASFASTTAVNEFLIGKNVAIFLSILAIVFAVLVSISSTKILMLKKTRKFNLFTLLFCSLGLIIGLALGCIVSKFVLTEGDANFDFIKVLVISLGVSCFLTIINIFILYLIIRKKK